MLQKVSMKQSLNMTSKIFVVIPFELSEGLSSLQSEVVGFYDLVCAIAQE